MIFLFLTTILIDKNKIIFKWNFTARERERAQEKDKSIVFNFFSKYLRKIKYVEYDSNNEF